MDTVTKLRALADRLEAADRELSALEEGAAGLREKADAVRAERGRLEAEIAATEQAIETLQTERADLEGAFYKAMFNSNLQEQQRITRRRGALDKDLQRHEAELQRLRASLDGLEDLDGLQREIAAGLDALNTGDENELRNLLRAAKTDLQNRRSEARRALPTESESLFTDKARRASDEAWERARLEAEQRNKELAREREEKRLAELWTKKPVTENGYIVAFDVFDEYGVKVRREEATVVTK